MRLALSAHPTVPSAHPLCATQLHMGKPRDAERKRRWRINELGHGVHQVLAAGQESVDASHPLTLAGDGILHPRAMLTFRSLLDANYRTVRERKAMLAQKVAT